MSTNPHPSKQPGARCVPLCIASITLFFLLDAWRMVFFRYKFLGKSTTPNIFLPCCCCVCCWKTNQFLFSPEDTTLITPTSVHGPGTKKILLETTWDFRWSVFTACHGISEWVCIFGIPPVHASFSPQVSYTDYSSPRYHTRNEVTNGL